MITPQANIAAVYCSTKRGHPSLEEAEVWAARHYACRICLDGSSRLGAYRCEADPTHFHVGHLGIRQ